MHESLSPTESAGAVPLQYLVATGGVENHPGVLNASPAKIDSTDLSTDLPAAPQQTAVDEKGSHAAPTETQVGGRVGSKPPRHPRPLAEGKGASVYAEAEGEGTSVYADDRDYDDIDFEREISEALNRLSASGNSDASSLHCNSAAKVTADVTRPENSSAARRRPCV